MPKASMNESKTPFLLAYASALPRTIQLTTINEIKTPNVEYSSGKKALESILTIVTNVAMITMNAGVLISSVMIFLNKETRTLEQIKTIIKSRPMPIAASTVLVVAKAGHVPRIDTNNGFSAIKPFKKFFFVSRSSSTTAP